MRSKKHSPPTRFRAKIHSFRVKSLECKERAASIAVPCDKHVTIVLLYHHTVKHVKEQTMWGSWQISYVSYVQSLWTLKLLMSLLFCYFGIHFQLFIIANCKRSACKRILLLQSSSTRLFLHAFICTSSTVHAYGPEVENNLKLKQLSDVLCILIFQSMRAIMPSFSLWQIVYNNE